TAAALALFAQTALPAPSLAAKLSTVNSQLKGYGLPEVAAPPDGMSPLLEIYGKDDTRETLLVGWNYPRFWIVERPSQDLNKEAGKLATGDYGKGDSAVSKHCCCD
ncbi:unnamed protein product, partial [Chrysoparadoxa australica]